jgi:hypothetical protein
MVKQTYRLVANSQTGRTTSRSGGRTPNASAMTTSCWTGSRPPRTLRVIARTLWSRLASRRQTNKDAVEAIHANGSIVDKARPHSSAVSTFSAAPREHLTLYTRGRARR